MSFIGGILGSDKKATLRHFAIGTFTLDVVTEESFQKTWSKTESAVETGARISDHRIANPTEIMIRGVVVNYEIFDFVDEVFPEVNPLLANIGLPMQISSVTDGVIATVNRYAATAKRYVGYANTAIETVSKLRQAKSFSDVPSLLNDKSDTDDRITKIKYTLEAIAHSEELIDVMTSTGVYKGVQIGAISVVRNKHGDAEFSILLSEIPTYDLQVVGGIDAKIKKPETPKQAQSQTETKPTGDKKSDRPATQAAKPQNKGSTNPPKTQQSALKTIINSAKGLF